MSILLTGFEPFDGASVNPSWEAVSRVPGVVAGQPVHHLLLPVEYDRAACLVRQEIRRLRPQIVISVGVASGRTAVTPELVALNYRYARIPDNAGRSFSGTAILPQGPAALMTRLPVHAMIDALKAADIPAALSLSAGAYVCNDVYWAVLACEEELGHRGLFIHVPPLEVLDADTAARALEICLTQ